MAEETGWVEKGQCAGRRRRFVWEAHVKSPLASLYLACSSVRKRVRVMMSVLTFSLLTGAVSPLLPLVVAMVHGREFEAGKSSSICKVDKASIARCEGEVMPR